MTSSLIHPTAAIDKGAELDSTVKVGAFAVIGPQVRVGAGTEIGSHAVISGKTVIGSRNLVSPFASLGSRPQDLKYRGEETELLIGDDNMFREYCNVSVGTVGGGSKTSIGNGNLFMVYTHVAHDCIIGHNCIVANGTAIAGHVTIDDGAVLGGLSAIHQFCRVGKLAMIAGGSMVAQDVVPYCMVHGDRARINGLNVVGLRRLGVKAESLRAIKEMYQIVFESNATLDDAMSRITAEIEDSPYRRDWLEFLRKGERGICR